MTSEPLYPWTRIGSPTMSLTGIFGFRDAYGSWKTICRSRRMGRISLLERVVSSRPLYRTDPDVGLCSCRIGAPGRRLATAGLTDQPQRLTGVDVEADVGDRLHDADRPSDQTRHP